MFWCDRLRFLFSLVASSALAAEAWTIRVACCIAGILGITDIMFESDCARLINILTESISASNWEFILWWSQPGGGVVHIRAVRSVIQWSIFHLGNEHVG